MARDDFVARGRPLRGQKRRSTCSKSTLNNANVHSSMAFHIIAPAPHMQLLSFFNLAGQNQDKNIQFNGIPPGLC